MSTDAVVLETKSDPRALTNHDLERNVAFEAIRAQLFTGPRQPVSIGRFQILERIGQGGMGVVYAASDPQLERKLAIKVVRDLGGDDDEIERARRSLEREARAAAGLRHPNVVTVYDSGRFGDGFYVAMEFVEGGTLRRWLGQGSRRWPEIVSMFIGAGRGLHAAHAAGLAHCDFKPDNVLIGPDERPQVSDFGLVRWIESRAEAELEVTLSQTVEGAPGTLQSVIAGTPRYMAPEQRRGLPIGPRSDQFSFCVALYESLFGAPPYVRERGLPFMDPGVLGRAHARTDVPRSIVRTILVGLSLAPEARHDSMTTLVERLERAMAERRRRRWWTVGAVAAITTGAVGYAMAGSPVDPCKGAAATMDDVWSDDARDAVRERLLATGTDVRAARITGLLDEYAEGWSAMRHASCEATHHEGGQSAEMFELRTVCLDRRLNLLRGFVERIRAADETTLRQVVAFAEGLPPLAQCEAEQIRIRTLVDAGATYNEKTRSLESQLAASVAEQRMDDAELLATRGALDAAIALLREIEAEARDAGLLYLEASAINLRVSHQLNQGATTGAIEELQHALAVAVRSRDTTSAAYSAGLILLARRLGAPEPVDAGMVLALGRSWATTSVEPTVRLAFFDLEEAEQLAAEGRVDDALQRLAASVEGLRAAGYAEHSMVLELESQRGRMLLDAHRPQDAIAALTEALERQRAALGSDHLLVGDTTANLGHAHRLMGDFAAARAHYADAQRILTPILGPKALRSAAITSGLAAIDHQQGHFEAARAGYLASIATNEALFGKEHPALAPLLNQLAELEHEMGAYDTGLSHAKQALALVEASFGTEHPHWAFFKTTVGRLELAVGNTRKAIDDLTPAHAALFANDELSPMWRGEVAFFLARAILQHDPSQRAKADALSRQAIDEYTKAQGETTPKLIAEIERWRSTHDYEDMTNQGDG